MIELTKIKSGLIVLMMLSVASVLGLLHVIALLQEPLALIALFSIDIVAGYIVQVYYHSKYWNARYKDDEWTPHPFYVLPWPTDTYVVFGRPPLERKWQSSSMYRYEDRKI